MDPAATQNWMNYPLQKSTCGRDMDTISESNQEGQTIDSAFLDAVGDTMDTCWTATVTLNSKDVIFKLDTGAEVTAITEETC